MIVALGVMLVTGLLLVGAFTVANGNVQLSHDDLTQKQAYYAALAGVQEYEYQLQANPNYWETCEEPSGTLSEGKESYQITLLTASSSKGATKCSTTNPFVTMIESKAPLANTFRIKSTGTAGTDTRSIVATLQVAGFLDYIYFTQYEDRDPESYKNGNSKCAAYRKQREALGILNECGTIVFGPEDNVNGPMHTDDTAVVCGGAEFGRKGHEPADAIEINGGTVNGGCGSGNPLYNTATGSSIVGPELEAPESDGSLRDYVENEPEYPQENEFTGLTHLVLEGTANKIKVEQDKGTIKKTIEWPKNGLIYVQSNSSGCTYKYEQENADTATTLAQEENCGSVYVSGNYSKPLTIAAEVDVVINGSITPTGVTPPAGPGSASTNTLGLIATRFVRVYHPCENDKNGGGSLSEPWIYAAILSTSHSFVVDNYNCGATLKNLNIDGAIGQKFRGIVGEVGTHGYNKEYTYDERLATDEPPYFLAPLKAGWRIIRETDSSAG
jgi:hypothetical protein